MQTQRRTVITPQATPRDTNQADQALTQVNDAQAAWTAAVNATDDAKQALDAAQATYDQAKVDEATTRQTLEAEQQNYAAAYDAIPKEDSLP